MVTKSKARNLLYRQIAHQQLSEASLRVYTKHAFTQDLCRTAQVLTYVKVILFESSTQLVNIS